MNGTTGDYATEPEAKAGSRPDGGPRGSARTSAAGSLARTKALAPAEAIAHNRHHPSEGEAPASASAIEGSGHGTDGELSFDPPPTLHLAPDGDVCPAKLPPALARWIDSDGARH
jgi:hypothetical protein